MEEDGQETKDVSLGASVLVLSVQKSSNFVVGQSLSYFSGHPLPYRELLEVQYMFTPENVIPSGSVMYYLHTCGNSVL